MQNEDWIKEFDKWFNHGTKAEPRFVYASDGYKEVKAFIRTLLQAQRSQLIQQVEGLRKKDSWKDDPSIMMTEGMYISQMRFGEGFNYALDDIIQLLKEVKEE